MTAPRADVAGARRESRDLDLSRPTRDGAGSDTAAPVRGPHAVAAPVRGPRVSRFPRRGVQAGRRGATGPGGSDLHELCRGRRRSGRGRAVAR